MNSKIKIKTIESLGFFVILKRKLEIRNHAWIYKDITSINTPDKLLLVISKTNNVDPH